MKEYDLDSPELEFKRADGSVIRFYCHKSEPHRFKVTVDGEPWNPNDMVQKVTKKIKK